MKKGFKICPFCISEIEEKAIKCPYCDELLNGEKDNKKGIKHSTVSKNVIGYVTFGRRFWTEIFDVSFNQTGIGFVINMVYALITGKTVGFSIMGSKIVKLDGSKTSFLQNLLRFFLYRPNIFTLSFIISFLLIYINATGIIVYVVWAIPIVMLFNFIERIIGLGVSSIFESRIGIKRIQYKRPKWWLLIVGIVFLAGLVSKLFEFLKSLI